MKNKKMIAILGVLVLVIIAAVIGNQLKTKHVSKNKTVKVGILQYVTHPALDEINKGIRKGLAEEGYKGKKVKIDFLNAEGDQSKVQAMSSQLVNDKNDVLIGIATPAAQGLANATKTIPVVMGAVSDPVGAKLVKSMKKPGGNVTGVSDKTPVKQEFQLIQKITPDVKTIGVLYSSSEDNSKSQVAEFKKIAESEGYKVKAYSVPSTNEIATTMSVMDSKVDAIWIPLDNTIASAFPTVIQKANEDKIPVYPSVDTMVEQGGIASIAVSQYDLGVATGKMTAKILEGKKVSTYPVTIYNKGDIVLNKKAADQLGITIPDKVIKKASKVMK